MLVICFVDIEVLERIIPLLSDRLGHVKELDDLQEQHMSLEVDAKIAKVEEIQNQLLAIGVNPNHT